MIIEGSAFAAARIARAACISAAISLGVPVILLCASLLAALPAGAATDVPPPVPTIVPAPVATPALPAAATVPAPAKAPAAPVVAKPAAKPAPKAAISNAAWKDLPPAQQQALSPLATEWDKLDVAHKSKWLAIARKFETMKPDDQMRIQERMHAWVALTPDQRRVARESYTRTKKLNTDQKTAQWEQYQQLPEEQKKKLAAEAAKSKVVTLPPAQSKGRTVPPIKSVHKPILQQSIAPKTGEGAPAAAPAATATATPAAADK